MSLLTQSCVLGSVLGVMGLVAGGASGQSFNVDFSTGVPSEGFGVPSSSFGGAANQPGFWMEFNTDVDGPVAAVGLDGQPTGVSLFLEGPNTVVTLNDSATSGDTEALLDDSIYGFGDVVGRITISGLRSGRYRVVVYGIAGGQPEQTTLFSVRDESALAGGAWSGSFEEGVTHAEFLTQSDGGNSIRIEAVGGVFGQSGYLNGFQLTAVDRCDVDFNFDGVLDNGDISRFVELFIEGSFFADLGGDTFVDNSDIGTFVNLFLAGGCP